MTSGSTKDSHERSRQDSSRKRDQSQELPRRQERREPTNRSPSISREKDRKEAEKMSTGFPKMKVFFVIFKRHARARSKVIELLSAVNPSIFLL